MTDHPLALCCSPPPPQAARPVSSPPQVDSVHQKKCGGILSKDYLSLNHLLPPPLKPKSLNLTPPFKRTDPNAGIEAAPLQQNAHREQPLSFASQMEGEDKGMASSFPISAASALPPRPSLDLGALSWSESSLVSLQDSLSNLSTRVVVDEPRSDDIIIGSWRSPGTEREKFLAKEKDDECQGIKVRTETQETMMETPTKVSELAKLSVFKDFSPEELQVISRSLSRRESERSAGSMSKRSGTSGSDLSKQNSFKLSRRPSSTSFFPEFSSCRGERSRIGKEFADNRMSTSPKLDTSNLIQKKYKEGGHADKSYNEFSWSRTKRNEVAEIVEQNTQFPLQKSSIVEEHFQKIFKDKLCNAEEKSHDPSRLYSGYSGLVRHLARTPFGAHTYPGPFQSRTEIGKSTDNISSTFTTRQPPIPLNDKKFTRPDAFGTTTSGRIKINPKHGIHFGPPRNPQCSCVSCRIWRLGQAARHESSSLPRPRSFSLTNISPLSSPAEKGNDEQGEQLGKEWRHF